MTNLKFALPDTEVTIALVCWGGSPAPIGIEDLDRFKNLMISVWEAIPQEDRALIESHWNCHCRETGRPPQMELSGGQVNGNPHVLATTKHSGMEIKYRWEICQFMPDEVFRALISHEMAHVYQWSLGKFSHNMTVQDLRGILPAQSPLFSRLRDDAIIEIHADETMITWGFDHVVPTAFLRQHFDFNDACGDYIRRKKPRSQVRSYKEAKGDLLLSRFDRSSLGEA